LQTTGGGLTAMKSADLANLGNKVCIHLHMRIAPLIRRYPS
jgi:hypothetical protein